MRNDFHGLPNPTACFLAFVGPPDPLCGTYNYTSNPCVEGKGPSLTSKICIGDEGCTGDICCVEGRFPRLPAAGSCRTQHLLYGIAGLLGVGAIIVRRIGAHPFQRTGAFVRTRAVFQPLRYALNIVASGEIGKRGKASIGPFWRSGRYPEK